MSNTINNNSIFKSKKDIFSKQTLPYFFGYLCFVVSGIMRYAGVNNLSVDLLLITGMIFSAFLLEIILKNKRSTAILSLLFGLVGMIFAMQFSFSDLLLPVFFPFSIWGCLYFVKSLINGKVVEDK